MVPINGCRKNLGLRENLLLKGLLGKRSGLRGGRFSLGDLVGTMPVQEAAVGLDAIRLGATRLVVLFLQLLFLALLQPFFSGLGRQFLGFFQSLLRFLGFQAQSFRPRLGALLLAFLLAGVAFAADWLQIRLEVVGTVIVIDLFSRLDLLDRADHDLALAGIDVGFGVRLAGVIDIARNVLAHRAVDGPAPVEFEQVFVL